jgi:hypothetical protein
VRYQHEPEWRGRSWQLTILEQRRRIVKLLRANPRLQPEVPALILEAYEDAAFSAMRETGLPLTLFPAHCPYAPAQVLDQSWLPGEG